MPHGIPATEPRNTMYCTWPHDFRTLQLKLGDTYSCNGKLCRLIKVTPKGFNLLNLESSRCILKGHLYDVRFRNKPLPHGLQTIEVKISYHWSIHRVEMDYKKEA